MQTEEEYRQEWLEGKHNTDYNNCRFTEDKYKFAIDWLMKLQPNTSLDQPQNIVDIICKQKIDLITDEQYCNKCQAWADKAKVQSLLYNMGLQDITIPTKILVPVNNQITEDNVINLVNSVDTQNVIIKCNHGSGWNITINKAVSINYKYITEKLNEWLQLNYAYISGYEKQYEKMTPIVIAQPLLIDKPLDYSFWCVDGNIEAIGLTKKFGKNFEEYFAFTDENGKQLPWYIGMKPEWANIPKSFMNNIERMKPIVKSLAAGFKFVRVDLYFINGNIYFGELTFTPCSGILELNKYE